MMPSRIVLDRVLLRDVGCVCSISVPHASCRRGLAWVSHTSLHGCSRLLVHQKLRGQAQIVIACVEVEQQDPQSLLLKSGPMTPEGRSSCCHPPRGTGSPETCGRSSKWEKQVTPHKKKLQFDTLKTNVFVVCSFPAGASLGQTCSPILI